MVYTASFAFFESLWEVSPIAPDSQRKGLTSNTGGCHPCMHIPSECPWTCETLKAQPLQIPLN
jgi:hypothetical protein